MPEPSALHYALSNDGYIAYRTCGSGDEALVLVSDWFSHNIDLWRPESPFLPLLQRLSSFTRLVTFDKRGVGLSDPVPLSTLPMLEEWVDDVRCVLDDAGIAQATVIGKGSGGPMAMLFAATHPERVKSIVLVNAWARLSATEDFPIGVPASIRDRMLDQPYLPSESVVSLAGEPIPPAVVDWWQHYMRNAASPSTSLTMRRWLMEVDVRAALPAIRCPTLVLARAKAWIGSEHGEYIAARINDARYVALPGSADFLFTGDIDLMMAEIEEFVTGERPSPVVDRVLATVLFTDLVGSTTQAAELGDRRWRDQLDRHDHIVREALRQHQGREIKNTGDGFLATFDGPARAIRCAVSIRAGLHSLGLEMRAGLHAGEIELRLDDIGGISVHIGARIEGLAAPGEILVSRTVRDLVAGSGIAFVDRGVHQLKGIPDDWQVYGVEA